MEISHYLQDVGKVILGSEAYIFHQGNILLHKRSETKKNFPGWWIAPGGHIDAGEDALTAAIREVREETGVTVSLVDIELKGIAFHHHTDRHELYVLYLFRAEIPEQSIVGQPTSEGSAKWIPVGELRKMNDIFPASEVYFDHMITNNPGILYTNSEWADSRLVKVHSRTLDR